MIYSVANNIISPLGITTAQNFEACRQGNAGITKIENKDYYPESFYGAVIDREDFSKSTTINDSYNYTFLEQLFISSIAHALTQLGPLNKNRTLLIISTTKGNIELLSANGKGSFPRERFTLGAMAKVINDHFNLPHAPVVVSNACISGLSAILTAQKFIEMEKYDQVIVAGGDTLSEFVVSGFQALKAIGAEPCRPYDAGRNGISLGEACGTMIISNDRKLTRDNKNAAGILGGAQSNDANHISGPSRTGAGLKIAILKALKNANIAAGAIDYINAHGTATLFNDEMEALAFDALGLGDTPLNSLKGYFGHTLGAAGIIESILTISQMNEKELLPSKGYASHGVSQPLNIIKDKGSVASMNYALKTTSGFGGCNAAVIFEAL